MLDFLLSCIFVWLILDIISSKIKDIRLNRFESQFGVMIFLNEKLLNNDTLYQEYKEKPFSIKVAHFEVYFDNYSGSIDFLNLYAKNLMKEFVKIQDIAQDCEEFDECEDQINEVIHETKMWLWSHGYLQIGNET